MKKEQGRSFPESTAWFLYIWNKNRGILVDKALGYACLLYTSDAADE